VWNIGGLRALTIKEVLNISKCKHRFIRARCLFYLYNMPYSIKEIKVNETRGIHETDNTLWWEA
jgi:hypothetical protein